MDVKNLPNLLTVVRIFLVPVLVAALSAETRDGDVIAAASSNLLLVLAAPVVAWVLVTWIVGAWQGRSLTPRWVQSPVFLSMWLAAIVVFTVARNLPVGSWLAP